VTGKDSKFRFSIFHFFTENKHEMQPVQEAVQGQVRVEVLFADVRVGGPSLEEMQGVQDAVPVERC
jgi:hypothetical protein